MALRKRRYIAGDDSKTACTGATPAAIGTSLGGGCTLTLVGSKLPERGGAIAAAVGVISAGRTSSGADGETRAERRRVAQLVKQDWRCGLCGGSVLRSDATWDHLVPLSRGGTGLRDNLVVAHKSCNRDKGHLTLGEYRAVLAYRAGG